MKQQQLTDLAMRKIYHAEQLGLGASLVQQMRDMVNRMDDGHQFAVDYITQEGDMIEPEDRTCLLDKRWNEFSVAMFGLSASVAGWIHQRVREPGGMSRLAAGQ